ncbi:exocyst complex component Sec10-domain-containing protein [Amylocarpus encephaloides]|uniref:Exocyst complex component Sec10-domain-containing protein n=1 Tax=Amylocarpus encephaloides TaxID=45428 RepID=A0A9P7YJ87_9HELO|nr:exocyst complex component Sec10-domain-containing protein [Amylocarpus encephaloides]
MATFKRAPVAGAGSNRSSILSSLKATQMIESKPILPAEIISTILDYLPIPDLISFARTSKRMLEMVYEDSRWVQRLNVMGVWNEREARKRFEGAMRRKREMMKMKHEEEAKKLGIGVNGGAGSGAANAGARKTSTTIFDAGVEEERQRRSVEVVNKPPTIRTSVDGFETLTLTPIAKPPIQRAPMLDPEALLNIFSGVKSIRGSARQEYGKIYAALAPFYFDLARSRSHVDPVIFRVYLDPEQQAQMLAHLTIFARSDWAQGWRMREERLVTMIGVFENAVLREFEQGCEAWDVDGKMRRYAHVLGVLNGGHAGIELFVQKHPLFNDRLGNSMDCINQAATDGIALDPSQQFLEKLAGKIKEQSDVIDRVFPKGEDVLQSLLDKVAEDILMEYVTPLFDEAHDRNITSYLKAVAGLFEQSMRFGLSLKASNNSGEDFPAKVEAMVARVFEPHVDLYLQEELDHFKRLAEHEVDDWEKKLSEQEATKESFFMGNFNRVADKKDFLSSFKKVVMMPVNVLPTAMSLPFGAPAPKPTIAPVANRMSLQVPSPLPSPLPSRPQTPGLGSSLPTEAPTDELAAKAALMASKLEGIRSLFSIEVALDLTHAAKASIERAALFVRLGGQTGEEAREQCEAIFVVLLSILGSRHVRTGFDKAVDHLGKYNPREVSEHQQGVAPLVTFLELVNVGDLISQMIDVFYEQQLAATKLADRNDFLDPAVKAKKKFEQMLDERVAAGLNKGIDVLMDEVEYVCGTLQKPTDFNPLPCAPGKPMDFDIGPTAAAKQIVAIVESHTKMLNGSTDKNTLDVFNQEVGLRLFTALCKHLKRQRVSTDGAIALISDMNIYFVYIRTLRNSDLLEYFKALRELSQIYLIEAKHAKELAEVIADGARFGGVFRAEEVYEFAERRADWYTVKRDVERAMYGIGCVAM